MPVEKSCTTLSGLKGVAIYSLNCSCVNQFLIYLWTVVDTNYKLKINTMFKISSSNKSIVGSVVIGAFYYNATAVSTVTGIDTEEPKVNNDIRIVVLNSDGMGEPKATYNENFNNTSSVQFLDKTLSIENKTEIGTKCMLIGQALVNKLVNDATIPEF